MNPIICVGNYHIDKKIKEMMKICDVIELKTPNSNQINKLISLLMPNLDSKLAVNLIDFINGDLRKLRSTYNIYKSQGKYFKK